MSRWVALLVLNAFANIALSQAMDNTAIYNRLNTDKYIRFSYDNDFFSGEDRYYTQGINLEFANPRLSKLPVYKLLIKPVNWQKVFTISAEHNAYTPTSIISDTILKGNRPFAAALFLKFSTIAIDVENKQRLSTTISAGVIGPAAEGEEIQYNIHKWTNNIDPKGWQHQIQNDLVLNYELNYYKNILSIPRFLSLDANGLVKAGTLSDKIALGMTLTTGYFNNQYSVNDDKNKISISAYTYPSMNFIGYDATMQGGILNRSSPYTIAAGDISRITFQNRFGFRFQYRALYLSYFQSYTTKEFATSNIGKFGGIQMAVGL